MKDKTSSREEAERVNKLYQYQYVKDMDDPKLLAWQQGSGLSFKELEMIQPAYHHMIWEPDMSHIKVEAFKDEETGKFGLKSKKTGFTKLKAEFDNIQLGMLPSGLGIVAKAGKYGVVNRKGRLKLDPEYDKLFATKSLNSKHPYLGDFFFGLKNKTLVVINSSGRVIKKIDSVQELRYSKPYVFFREGTKWGVLFTDGKLLVPPLYEQIHNAHYSCFLTKGDSGYGLLNTIGDTIVPLSYKWVYKAKRFWKATAEGYIDLYDNKGNKSEIEGLEEVLPYGNSFYNSEVIGKKNGKLGLISSGMTWLLPPEFDEIQKVLDFIIVKKDGKEGYYSVYGPTLFLEPVYQKIQLLRDRFIVKKDGKTGLLSKEGEVLVPIEMDSIQYLAEVEYGSRHMDFLFAMQKGKEWTIRDVDGKILPGTGLYEGLLKLDEGIFAAKMEGFYYLATFANNSFKLDSNSRFKSIQLNSYKNHIIYEREEGFGVWGLYNHNPLELSKAKLTDPIYEEIKPLSSYGGGYLVKKDGKYGVLGHNCKVLFDCRFTDYKFYNRQGRQVFLKDERGWHKAFLNGTIEHLKGEPSLINTTKIEVIKQ